MINRGENMNLSYIFDFRSHVIAKNGNVSENMSPAHYKVLDSKTFPILFLGNAFAINI